jgi:hypothetical protein
LWEEFEKIGFPVIDFLFNIAEEFQNQLHFDKTRLLTIVTERYFFEIEHFLIELRIKIFFLWISK